MTVRRSTVKPSDVAPKESTEQAQSLSAEFRSNKVEGTAEFANEYAEWAAKVNEAAAKGVDYDA